MTPSNVSMVISAPIVTAIAIVGDIGVTASLIMGALILAAGIVSIARRL